MNTVPANSGLGLLVKAIPAELRNRTQWVCWKYGPEPNTEGKYPKLPYHPKPYRASHSNARTWVTFAEALHAYTERPDYFNGIGFVFAADDPYTGIDFDDCLNEQGAFCSDWAASWVQRLNSRTEISPSGRGVKVIVRGSIPAALKHERVELYQQQRFFTMTGNLLPTLPIGIRDAQPELDALYAEERGNAPQLAGPLPTIDMQALPNVTPMLGTDRIPRGLTERSQGRRVLVQALTGWPEGAPDYSLMRCILVNSLVMHGYRDEQIAALLWYYRPALNGGNKNIHNWTADIARMISKARIKYPNAQLQPRTDVVPTSDPEPLQCPAPPAKASRARKDRPQKVSGANGYLAWLQTQADAHTGVIMQSIAECATSLGVNVRTIRRYEKTLRETNQIERRTYANRQHGCIYLLAAFERRDNIPESMPETTAQHVGTGDPDSAQQNAVCSEISVMEETQVSTRPEPATPDTPPTCVSPSPAPQRLPELAAEALAVYGMPPAPTVEQITAALADTRLLERLRTQKPNTPDHVLVHTHLKRKNSRDHLAVLRHYVISNASRNYGKKAISQAVQTAIFKADLATATPARLRSQLHLLEKRRDADQKSGNPAAKVWAFKAGLVRAELQRRPPEPNRKIRKETAPQLSDATRERIAQEQLNLAWRALEDDRRKHGKPQPRTIAKPTDTPAPDRPAYEQPGYVAGMIARFKAMQQHPTLAST